MTPKPDAQLAYEAYAAHTGNRSLVTNALLPEWRNLSPAIQAAWGAAVEGLAKERDEWKRRAESA